jgi:hypothetical protein
MRKTVLRATSAAMVAASSPAFSADLPVTRYSEGGATYQREVHSYEYRSAPRVVVTRPVPVVTETIVVRRPVVVAPPPVLVEEYPVYAAPIYAAPPVYAYGHVPGWRRAHWGPRRHFPGRW